MPSRWTNTKRRHLYGLLVERDGPLCRSCKKPPPEGERHSIDHIDNNKNSSAWTNLQILCRSCNTSKRNRYVSQVFNERPNGPIYNLVRKHGTNGSTPNESNGHLDLSQLPPDPLAINEESAPALVQLSKLYRTRFWSWVIPRLENEESAPHTDVIYAGAKIAGCSPQAIREYLKEELSSVGRIEVFRAAENEKRVRLRP